ncbi:hypothetical protein FH972_013162 [Carpinus fangiana]|uniref:Fe2OG dioxygenase domain-containing protein n=1 Tax=Carpinus fangiana TaxID=176857 RepID=A0A5N6R939_9ROSI|nr:hypothetical protein FH972_013162 [Carpinus fangiana]
MSESEVTMNLELETYPPLFRQLNNQSRTHGKVIEPVGEPELPMPVIDLHCLSPEELGGACRDWGLFRLVNHGVPSTLLRQLHEHAKELFSLSFECKKEIFCSPSSYLWGTTATSTSGAALLTGPQNIHWVEGFHFPLGQLSQLQTQDPTLASFRLLLEEYGKHLARLGRTIFKTMAMELNLDPGESETHLDESTGFLRVYRYPLRSMANSAWGIEVHTDSSVLTILNQYEVGGLEILKDNQWLQVKPTSDTLIVNLGDMMQAISNDEYKSVKHRVRLNKDRERISMGYFVFPKEDSVIRSSKYKPFTHGDFRAQVQQDLKTLGFKVGLEKFKLTHASSS